MSFPGPADRRKRAGAGIMTARWCLCNGLMAAAGFAQRRAHGYTEPVVITAGTDFTGVRNLLQRLPVGLRPIASAGLRRSRMRDRGPLQTGPMALGCSAGPQEGEYDERTP